MVRRTKLRVDILLNVTNSSPIRNILKVLDHERPPDNPEIDGCAAVIIAQRLKKNSSQLISEGKISHE